MYYPFKNERGRVPLGEVKEEDVRKFLNDVPQESMFFEFKETFDSNVRQKLGAVISSFANERGGWILIGVRDTDRAMVGIDNLDFDQIIGNIVKTKISPIAYYELKTVSLGNTGKLILIVMVPEGVDGPYIIDGTIFRRIGSNSIGTQKIKDRHDFETITNRAEIKRNRFKKFCKPDVNVYDRKWIKSMYGANGYYTYYGVANIYFILPDVQPSDFLSLETKETQNKIKDVLNATIEPKNTNSAVTLNIPFPRYSYAHNSLIFRHNEDVKANSQTIILQFFRNGWCRVHLPIPYLDKINLCTHPLYDKIQDIDNKIIDGQALFKGIFSVISVLEFMRSSLFSSYQRYLLAIKIKNIRNNVVFINGSHSFSTHFSSNHLPLVETSKFKVNKDLLIDDVDLDWNYTLYIMQELMMGFNIPPQESTTMFIETCLSPSLVA